MCVVVALNIPIYFSESLIHAGL